MSMTIIDIPLEDITPDPRLQMRVEISQEHVDDIAEALADGKELDAAHPPVVFHDGFVHWLADGFHRYYAHAKVGREVIRCDMRPGLFSHALRFALSANQHTSLKRTNADKRKCVATALADKDMASYSDRQLADLCGVSTPLVGQVRSKSSGVERTAPAREALTLNGLQSSQPPTTVKDLQSSQSPATVKHLQSSHPPATVKDLQSSQSPATVKDLQSDTIRLCKDGRQINVAQIGKTIGATEMAEPSVEKIENIASPPKSDSYGNVLMERLIAPFGERELLLRMSGQLKAISVEIRELSNRYRNHNFLLGHEVDPLERLSRTLADIVPEAVCPNCEGLGKEEGRDCVRCDRRGYLRSVAVRGMDQESRQMLMRATKP